MQTILNVPINPSVRDWEEQYKEKFLKVMLDNGAEIIHVTPILVSSSTKSLSYVIKEPETEEYKKIKEEQFKKIQERIDYLARHNNR